MNGIRNIFECTSWNISKDIAIRINFNKHITITISKKGQVFKLYIIFWCILIIYLGHRTGALNPSPLGPPSSSTVDPTQRAYGAEKVFLYHDGILPKGPYPPCLRMADRALLAGYPRYIMTSWCNSQASTIPTYFAKLIMPNYDQTMLNGNNQRRMTDADGGSINGLSGSSGARLTKT